MKKKPAPSEIVPVADWRTGFRNTAMTDHLITLNTRPVTVVGHTDLDWDLLIKASLAILAGLVLLTVVL